MTVEDVPTVAAIDKASFSLPWPDRSFTYEVTSNENSIPLVAVVKLANGSAEIAGFIVVWIIIDEAHIGTIAIAEPFRCSGLGEAIIREGLRQSIQRGALQAYLEVRQSNIAAIKMYEKLGFEVDGVRQKYYQDNHEDAILMSLKSFSQL